MYTPAQRSRRHCMCMLCGNKHHERKCPTRQKKQKGPKPSPTRPVIKIPRAIRGHRPRGPAPPLVILNSPPTKIYQPAAHSASSGQNKQNKNKKQSTDRSSEEKQTEQTDKEADKQTAPGYVSSITKPNGAEISPSAENDSEKKTEPSRPAVTVVITHGKNSRYLNGTNSLLTRQRFSTRQIVLNEDDISMPHAVIRFEPSKRVTIRDLRSAHGTFVNGQRVEIDQAVELKHNSRIRFGTSSEYDLDLHQRQLRHPAGGRIKNLSNSDLWLITQDHFTEIAEFKDPHLSSPHFLIQLGDADRPLTFKLLDLGSANGTYINGHDLRQMREGTFIAEREVKVQIGKGERPDHYHIEAQWIERAYQPGDPIGSHYVIEKLINHTSMSDLYLVRENESFNGRLMIAKMPYTARYGANKVLPAFEREASLMKSLRHPNLLPAEQSGETLTPTNHQPQPYLIMPYIQGCNLGSLLSRRWQMQNQPKGLRLVDVKAIFTKLLSAVEYLHDQAWVHCDLKPENILLGDDGQVCLIDLGAATQIGQRAHFHNEAFSAPEINTKAVNERSDIYSLGKILLELVTDQTYHQDLHHIINKATSPDPNKRYRNIAALRQALKKAYTDAKSTAALKQEGTANLARLARQYADQL